MTITNTRRLKLLSAISLALSDTSIHNIPKLRELVSEFNESGRGKRKGSRMIKSIALSARPKSKYMPHQGKKECQRRLNTK